MLGDVISKFKKERSSLKSRILKLESRMNQMTFDETLEVKPVKAGAKSVQQFPQCNEDNLDSKSEIAVAKSNLDHQPVPQKQSHQNDIEAIKQDKHESQSASGANTGQTKNSRMKDPTEESKSVSFAEESKGGAD